MYEAPIAMTCGIIQVPEQVSRSEAEGEMWLMVDEVWRQRPEAEAVFANWVSGDRLVVFVPDQESSPC